MGLFGELLGHASQISVEQAATEFGPILAPGETVELAFRLVRDAFVFTSFRLVLVSKQGLTGTKVEYLSIPYGSITSFAVETAGVFELDAELKLWVRDRAEPIVRAFTQKVNIYAVQAFIATKVR